MDLNLIEVMKEANKELFSQDSLTTEVAQFTSSSSFRSPSERDSVRTELAKKFAIILANKLNNKGLLESQFTYAVTNPNPSEIFFGSAKFEANQSNLSTYSYPLTGIIKEKCHCQLILRLKVENMFSSLLEKLQQLIIPSILFFFLLAACCIWLVRSINRQRKLAEIKNDFINNLTHELKTPVFSVSLASKMLEHYIKDLPSEKPKEYLKLIRAENEKMKGHIDAVLELASLENGNYIMDKTEVEMDTFLAEIVENYTPEFEKNNATLEAVFAAKNTSTFIDKTHFKNVIKNIFENAKKYNDKKNLHLKISTYSTDNQFVIKIKDNGKGISKENQKHIFEKFYRVREGDLHVVKGFGLGLSYVHQVIQEHNGNVTVESIPDISTTFTIKIPVK